jgi:hypothetical protein
MPKRTAAWLPLAAALLLAACSNATSEKESTTVVDIKDIVLTNMSGDCADYGSPYEESVQDVQRGVQFLATFTVSEAGDSCSVTSCNGWSL